MHFSLIQFPYLKETCFVLIYILHCLIKIINTFFPLFSYSVLVCNLGWNKMLVVPHVVVVSVYIVTVVSMCMLMRYELMNQKIIKGQAIITFFISMVRFLFEFDFFFFAHFYQILEKKEDRCQKWHFVNIDRCQTWQLFKLTKILSNKCQNWQMLKIDRCQKWQNSKLIDVKIDSLRKLTDVKNYSLPKLTDVKD